MKRRSLPTEYRPGTTVVIANWNSLPFLQVTVAAIREMSPNDVEILVVDNASTDGSRAWLRARDDVRVIELPVNVGHGVALDIAATKVDTEFLAVLDVDAFPIAPTWLDESIAALRAGAKIAGGHWGRNYVHPCFLVVGTETVHRFELTFRPVGWQSTEDDEAPLFLDVAEAMTQRLLIKFGGSPARHFFEITESRGVGDAGAVFGDLVYHNMFATQGIAQGEALGHWRRAVERFHPSIAAQHAV